MPSSLTFHLQNLQHAGLIAQRRESRQLIYSADFTAMTGLVGYLTDNCCADSAAAVLSAGTSGRSAAKRAGKSPETVCMMAPHDPRTPAAINRRWRCSTQKDYPPRTITEAHFEHFFFTGSDGTPTALVGLEIYGRDALLRSLVVSANARTQGLGSALVLHAEQYAAAHEVRALYLLTTTAESFFGHLEAIGASIARSPVRSSNPRVSSRAFARQAPPS